MGVVGFGFLARSVGSVGVEAAGTHGFHSLRTLASGSMLCAGSVFWAGVGASTVSVSSRWVLGKPCPLFSLFFFLLASRTFLRKFWGQVA